MAQDVADRRCFGAPPHARLHLKSISSTLASNEIDGDPQRHGEPPARHHDPVDDRPQRRLTEEPCSRGGRM